MKSENLKNEEASNMRNLAKSNPELAAEWAFEKNTPLTPNDVRATSHRKVQWICPRCGRAWTATVYSRTHGLGCPYDSGKLIPPEASLAISYPEIAKEWDDRPDMVSSYSSVKTRWKVSNRANS